MYISKDEDYESSTALLHKLSSENRFNADES